jgi:hypothetical protein
MKIDFLPEPELEFGTGRHVDIRFGLMNHGPLDSNAPLAPKKIRLGLVGTAGTVEGVHEWLERCRNGIEAKKSHQPNLFPKFPGYGPDTNLGASFLMDPQLEGVLSSRELEKLCQEKHSSLVIQKAAEMFLDQLQHVSEKGNVDVLICAVPMLLYEHLVDNTESSSGGNQEGGTESGNVRLDFHHLLKAKAMSLSKPIQIILPMTYDEGKRRPKKRKPEQPRQLQDEATRAWNFYTALYYKAGGRPWRLTRENSQATVCYIGIGFYKTLDNSRTLTSTAQVFNERGNGVILRGGSVKLSKSDRQVHLQADDAKTLLDRALKTYQTEHGNLPARVVLYKSSNYSPEENEGFSAALRSNQVQSFDFTSIRDSFTRLYRNGRYPTLRGTLFAKDDVSHVLYTRGSVDFFCTYPGMYVPRPLEFKCENTEQTPKFLAQEILALTKMNWNNTQFDNSEPIVLKAARRVGDILKYLDEEDVVQTRYSFYM